MTTRGAAGRIHAEMLAILAIAVALGVFVIARLTVTICTSEVKRPACMANAVRLTGAFIEARRMNRFDPTLHGSAQILSWFGPGGLPIGDEKLLFCMGGQQSVPETREEAAAFHPADAAATRAARGLGSYAVRDFERFPLIPPGVECDLDDHAVICDLQGEDGRTMHHVGGIVVGYESGNVRFHTKQELGYGPEEPIVVGPDSTCRLLRVFERP